MINATYKSSHFLLSALECMEYLIDGVMLVSHCGEVIYMNQTAEHICQTLNESRTSPTRTSPTRTSPTRTLPQALWQTCQTLVQTEFTALTSEATIQSYRVRVQQVLPKRLESPCFMVRIEDQQQTLDHCIMAEIQQYGLTQREAEVWRLKRENLSRQEIANRLFISVDTVKKHLCNIQLKRHTV